MPKTFEPADDEARATFDVVLSDHFSVLAALHPPLRFDLLFATDRDRDDNPVPALKKHGHHVAAYIKRVPDDEKAKGSDAPDLRIVIDKLQWDDLGEREREALLHHETSHVEPKRDKHGVIRLDRYGRVAVRLRPDDWMLTGFRQTVAIFGQDALERQALDGALRMLRQRDLPFGDEAEPSTVAFRAAAGE